MGTYAAGSAVNFAPGTGAEIRFATNPTLNDGIIGGGATYGNEWATTPVTGPYTVSAYSAYTTGAETTWVAANNIKLTAAATTTLTAARTINSLNLAPSSGTLTVAVNSRTFKIDTGGLLISGGGTTTITGTTGTIAAGPGNVATNLVVTQNSANPATMSCIIANNGSGVRLTKAGAGTLILTGTNTYTGVTNVASGILKIGHKNALGGTGTGTTVLNGATLQIYNTITTAAEPLTLNGVGVYDSANSRYYGALNNSANNNTWAGDINLASDARINSDSGTLTINGGAGIAGTGGNWNVTFGGRGTVHVQDPIANTIVNVTKDNSSGTLRLNATNKHTGITYVTGGNAPRRRRRRAWAPPPRARSSAAAPC